MLSDEQRRALAELLEEGDEEPQRLSERLSLHGRLLISELVLVLHAPSEALAADLAAEQAQHGDIVLLKEVAEGYDRLLPKQAAVFRWLQRHSQSAFVFRCVRAPTLRSAHCNCPV